MDTLSTVKKLWDEANSVAGLVEGRWVKNKRLAHSEHLTKRKFGQSSIFVPMTEQFHYRKQADYFFAFSGDNPVSLKQTLTSTKEGATIMERVVNFYIKEAGGIDWDSSVLNSAHNALTYNFAPWFVDWDRDVENFDVEVEQINNDGEIETVKVEQERELYSYPTLEVISPDDMRIDPSIGWNEIGLARYGIIRRWRDKAFARKMFRSGDWPEIEDRFFTSKKDQLSRLKAEQNNAALTYSNAADGFIEVWYSFFYNEDGIPVRAVTIENLLELEPEAELEFDTSDNDGSDPWSFGVGIIYAEPHQIYSRAMPEKLEQLQIEKNAIRNQRRDAVSLTLNPEKYVTPNAGIDPARLSRSIQGKVNTVANKDSVWWDRPPEVSGNGYNEEVVTTTDAEQLVSESAQRSGGSSPRKETATVAKITAANSNAASSLDAGVFSMTFTDRAVKKIIRMIRQAAPPALFEAAAEEAMVDVNDPYQEALTGSFKVAVGNGVQSSARDTSISQASNTAAILQAVYGPQANYYPIMAPMLEDLGHNPDEIIQNPAAQQPNQQITQDAGGVNEQIPPQQVSAVQGGQFGSADQENQNT